MRTPLKVFLFLLLLVGLLGIGLEAYAVKTTLSPSEVLAKLTGTEKIRSVDAFQATSAVGLVGGFVADKAYRLRGLTTTVGIPAGSGNTVVTIWKNNAFVASSSVTTAHDAAVYTRARVGLDVAIAIGDTVNVHVSSITSGTASKNLTARIDLAEVY